MTQDHDPNEPQFPHPEDNNPPHPQAPETPQSFEPQGSMPPMPEGGFSQQPGGPVYQSPVASDPKKGKNKKKTSTAGLVLGVLFFFCVMGSVSGTIRDAVFDLTGRDSQAEKDLAKHRAKIRADIKKILKEEEESGVVDGSKYIAHFDQSVSNLTEILMKHNIDDTKIIQATVRELKKLRPILVEYYSKLETIQEFSAQGAGSFKNYEDLEKAIQVCQQAEQANQKMKAFFANLQANMTQAVRKAGMSNKQSREFGRGVAQGAQTRSVIQIRDYDSTIMKNMIITYEILKQEWGKWTYDPIEGVIFESISDADLKRFNDAITGIDKAAIAQENLQKRILN